jgi:hypothetical protein
MKSVIKQVRIMGITNTGKAKVPKSNWPSIRKGHKL